MEKAHTSSVIYKQFFGAMIVMTMMELAHAAATLVDGAMAGRLLGAKELAALGICTPYYSIAAVISGVLMTSCQTMCARSVGSGRLDEADRVFSLGCTLGIVLSCVMTAVGIILAGPFARLLGARGASAELLPYAKSYLIGLFTGTPGLIMVAILSPIVQLDGGAKRTTVASLTITVVDVIGDVLFMVVMKMGLLGLGLGTAVSNYAALAVLLTHFRKKDRLFHFRAKDMNWRLTPKIVAGGLPSGATQICRAVGPILINSIVLSVAATAGLSALSAQSNVKLVVRSPIVGMAGAVMLMTGVYAGEKDVNGLKQTVRVTLWYAVGLMGVIAGAVILFAPALAAFYLPDSPEAREMATNALRWFALSLPPMAVNMCVGNYLTALGDRRRAYTINIGNELISLVACVAVLGKLFGINGVWAAYCVSQLVTLGVFLLCGALRRDTDAKGAEKLLFLPRGFSLPESDYISVSVTGLEQVIGISEAINAFCTGHGVDRRRSYLAALCVEEMAGNTVTYGFADGKRHSVDIRVVLRDGDVLLRLRDDCAKFDLKEKVRSWTLDPERPEENVGIRMVLALSKDVTYTNTMDMNNLLITI